MQMANCKRKMFFSDVKIQQNFVILKAIYVYM